MHPTDHPEHLPTASAPAADARADARDGADGPAAGRMPDFLIVGHAKSGTTALYEMLSTHPQIYMSVLKEPWFFATDMRPRFKPPHVGDPPRDLAAYAALFAGAGPGQRAGEASSSYLWSTTAARGIAEAAPDARIIAILREPTSFLRSLHLQLLQNHVESEQDFRRAIELEADRREGRNIPRRSHRPQLLQYADLVRYTDQLRRYEELFPSEQMLVLIYEEFRADNAGTLRHVLRFLDVDETFEIPVLDVNPSVRLRSQQLDSMVHAVSVGRGSMSRLAHGTIKALTPRALRRRALTLTRRRVVQGTPRPVDEAFVLDLKRRFKPEVELVSEHLGRDLVSLWGYDGLD
jgi:hypothetical protein